MMPQPINYLSYFSHNIVFIIQLTFMNQITHYHYPPAREGRREAANLTQRRNPHTPVYGVTEFVCLSVCLSVAIYPNVVLFDQQIIYKIKIW